MAQQHPRSRASVRRAVSSDADFLGSLPRARQQNGLPILASVRVDILGGRGQVSKWLARKLPKIFMETFGEWAASERRSGAVDRMFSSSPAEEADEDDDVGDAAV